MSKVKLTYFDFAGGRGEACRLALYLAGIDFIDDRVDSKSWPSLKSSTPFGGLPVLEIEGKGVISQSNAILGVIGANHDLLPKDSFEAAKHIAILNACEEFNAKLSATIHMDDDQLKKKMREELANGYIKAWGKNIEQQIQGPFFGGDKISVADFKLYTIVNWIKKGVLDHIPASSFDEFTKLNTLFDSVVNHPKIIEWYKNH